MIYIFIPRPFYFSNIFPSFCESKITGRCSDVLLLSYCLACFDAQPCVLQSQQQQQQQHSTQTITNRSWRQRFRGNFQRFIFQESAINRQVGENTECAKLCLTKIWPSTHFVLDFKIKWKIGTNSVKTSENWNLSINF